MNKTVNSSGTTIPHRVVTEAFLFGEIKGQRTQHAGRPRLQCFARSGRKVQDIGEHGLTGLDKALGDVVRRILGKVSYLQAAVFFSHLFVHHFIPFTTQPYLWAAIG